MGVQERLRKTGFIILTGPRETESLHTERSRGGGPGKWAQPSRRGAKREDEAPWTSTFMEGQGGVRKKRDEGISLVQENVTRSRSGAGRKTNLVVWPTLSHGCT